jgi:hypothetical protein
VGGLLIAGCNLIGFMFCLTTGVLLHISQYLSLTLRGGCGVDTEGAESKALRRHRVAGAVVTLP